MNILSEEEIKELEEANNKSKVFDICNKYTHLHKIIDQCIYTIRQLRSIDNINPDKITPEYIPYQTCPLCNGFGGINHWVGSTGCISTCDVCGGKKIIPMYAIPEISNQKEQP